MRPSVFITPPFETMSTARVPKVRRTARAPALRRVRTTFSGDGQPQLAVPYVRHVDSPVAIAISRVIFLCGLTVGRANQPQVLDVNVQIPIDITDQRRPRD